MNIIEFSSLKNHQHASASLILKDHHVDDCTCMFKKLSHQIGMIVVGCVFFSTRDCPTFLTEFWYPLKTCVQAIDM